MAEMIPWCTGEYTIEYCRQKAKELRETGNYKMVRVRKTVVEKGKAYGRIYVDLESVRRGHPPVTLEGDRDGKD